jgi:hypothetical protein
MASGRKTEAVDDYSGTLREDFHWGMLSHKTLARFGREVMLCNQVHDRAIMPILAARFGMEAMTSVAIDEWMGSSPIYNARNRVLHGITGDGVDVIMKGFQLDIGAPHMWLKFHYDVRDHDEGFFWLTSCGAYNHVRAMTNGDPAAETQICVHMEDPTFDATVMAVNRGARCEPVFRPPHGRELPAEGPCRWRVSIADRIGVVEENAVTELVRASRAAGLVFTVEPLAGDGLADYSGPFKRDFMLEDLCGTTLLRQVKEFALDVHLLQRACYHGIDRQFGRDHREAIIAEHWAAMAPVYQARTRRLLGIEGDGLEAILKLLQLDHHFVPEYLVTGVRLLDATRGLFWIEDCPALGDGDPAGVLSGLLQGDTLGLQQAVQSVNPRARVERIDRAGVAGGRARLAWAVYVDDHATPAEPSGIAELVGANGLLEADLSEHLYSYPD